MLRSKLIRASGNSVGGVPTVNTNFSGGTISLVLVGSTYYQVHTFTSSGSFVYNNNIKSVEYLIVGAGGSGNGTDAAYYGGGGGGGGVISGTYTLPVGTSTSVVVGNAYALMSGGNSSLLGLTAIGGGLGAYGYVPVLSFAQRLAMMRAAAAGTLVAPYTTASTGGSGGGGTNAYYGTVSASSAAGISGQGHDGGNSSVGGGGGGAGSAASSEAGGSGIISTIRGIPELYSPGGNSGGVTAIPSSIAGAGSNGTNTTTVNAPQNGIVIIRFAI